MAELTRFIAGLPKAELHVHIEGTLEPEFLFERAAKNDMALPYASVEDARAAYDFQDLQDFLDLYYQGTGVLLDEEDFYDLAWAYFDRARRQNVLHAEVIFDPQAHTRRGIPFTTVIDGLWRAARDAETDLGITSGLILCFLRDLSQEDALQTLDEALPYGDKIIGVGLDSAERGNPPDKFADVFARAKTAGFRRVAHAGEEGPADYIRKALDALDAERIDHGVRCLEDPELVGRLTRQQTPLTVCPLSNVRLKVFPDIAHHPIRALMDAGLLTTVNSDDPAYFGGYVNENYQAVAEAWDLSADDLCTLARNSFKATFLGDADKSDLVEQVYAYQVANQA